MAVLVKKFVGTLLSKLVRTANINRREAFSDCGCDATQGGPQSGDRNGQAGVIR